MEPPLKTFKAMNLTILEEYGKELGEAGAPSEGQGAGNSNHVGIWG